MRGRERQRYRYKNDRERYKREGDRGEIDRQGEREVETKRDFNKSLHGYLIIMSSSFLELNTLFGNVHASNNATFSSTIFEYIMLNPFMPHPILFF